MASGLWVFGYGSLIWNPGFEHKKALIGQIKGYSRRFYQGSDVHRGRPDKLGRVVTLIEDELGSTWGTAFLPNDEQVARSYLDNRENHLGGYDTLLTYFYPRDPKEDPFLVLVYVALPSNSLYLGADPVPKIAHDIATSEGECGHNVEYISKLVAFMKIELPYISDEHLFDVENIVKAILEEQQSPVLKLFTDAINAWISKPSPITTTSTGTNEEVALEILQLGKQPSDEAVEETVKPFSFMDSLPKRKLRCVHKF